MANELRYGEGGMDLPRIVDFLSTPRHRRTSFEDTWAAKCESATEWEPPTRSSDWGRSDPPLSPRLPTYSRETQEFWKAQCHQRQEIDDGWLPEPDEAPRSAKAPIPEGHPPGNAILTYSNDGGELVSIPGLNLSIIEERSLLLATAFEGSQSGQRLYLETLSELTAMPLLRYLYTGSYAESDFWEDVPTSLLLHCRMYQLGLIYDLDELEKQAKFNIRRQCEFGCSSPDKPIDLCRAIRFAYEELKGHDGAISEIIHYCVSRFLDHNLGEDAEFKSLAYEVRPFHQDLVKTCKDRGYADDSAAAIIQMPYKPYRPDTYASTETPQIARFEDLVFHFHGLDDSEGSPLKRARLDNLEATDVQQAVDKGKQKIIDRPRPKSALTLALRQAVHSAPKQETSNISSVKEMSALPIRSHPSIQTEAIKSPYLEETSASEDEDMLIVRKRKQAQSHTEPDKAIFSGSDSDFELLSGPDAILSASSEDDDDSDAATLVEAPTAARPIGGTPRFAPERTHLSAVATGQGDADVALSEWEWEDVM